jgi:hypothetical protein
MRVRCFLQHLCLSAAYALWADGCCRCCCCCCRRLLCCGSCRLLLRLLLLLLLLLLSSSPASTATHKQLPATTRWSSAMQQLPTSFHCRPRVQGGAAAGPRVRVQRGQRRVAAVVRRAPVVPAAARPLQPPPFSIRRGLLPHQLVGGVGPPAVHALVAWPSTHALGEGRPTCKPPSTHPWQAAAMYSCVLNCGSHVVFCNVSGHVTLCLYK